ncbi:MAG TPA: sugar phosphate isomerase/epimerase family protein [Verrucomicrobiota bacterium]|nr:sugar phosphate isomerase/epimerase family protein [Verrucomicrobiota bacterium]HNU49996.1 sugar phosphate isomerase/epimerase family protein [Verrucomicrobiota bacterium]
MKFAICNEIFRGWDLPRTMAFAAQTGYDALEIAPFTLTKDVTRVDPARRAWIRHEADRAGIAVSGIHWVLVDTIGLHLTHPDPAVRSLTRDYFIALVDFCADIGGHTIVVGSPKQRSLLPEVTPAQGADWALEVFRDAVRRAEDRDVTLCVEPLAPEETNFLNTAADAIAFIQRLPSPRFKIILDVKAMCSESKPIPDIIRSSWPHFAYVHANDRNLEGPGFGDVDFRPIAAALRDVGYDGTVSVEVFKFDPGPEAIAQRSLACLRAAFDRPQGVSSHI